MPSGQTAALAYLDETARAWVPVVTTVSKDRMTLTAHVTHFSIWDDLLTQIGEKTGNRGSAPRCEGRIRQWATDVVFLDDPNSPLRVCTGSDPARPGVLVVKVANNRGYGLALRSGVDPSWVWSSAGGFAGPENFLTYGVAAGLNLPATVQRIVSHGAFIPPDAELDLGFAEASVRGLRSGPLLAASIDLTYVVAGLAYKALAHEAGERHVAIDAMVSPITAWQCLHNLGTSRSWDDIRSAGYDCVVSNFEEARKLVVDIGSHLRVAEATLGAVAAAVQRVLMAVFAFSTGFAVGEALSDLTLDPAAFEVRAYLRPVPRTLDLTLRPGRLGSLRIGMSGAGAVKTGYIKRASGVICGSLFDNSNALTRLVGETSVYADFRFGKNPDDLDSILIKGPQPKNTRGDRRGCDVRPPPEHVWQPPYRHRPGPVHGPGNEVPDYAVFGPDGALIFATYVRNGPIEGIWVTSGASPADLFRPFGEC